LLSTSFKILSNILLARLTPYADDITGNHQQVFRCKRSATDHISCIQQILEKKWEYNSTEYQLFIDFMKASDSVKREVLYNIPIQFGTPRKLGQLTKMCLNKTYTTVHIDK
jgi:hypothetical protein